TRKILARDSGVSERYLAQLEGGHGNISIILLRQVAQAMGLPLADLARDGPERPVELALLLQALERLSPPELSEARRLLGGAFGLLLSACFTVWLKAAPEEHMSRVVAQGDVRPMADNAEAMEDLRRILAGREALYAKADAVVDTAGRTIEESLAALRAAIAT